MMNDFFDPEPTQAEATPPPRSILEQPGGLRSQTRMTIQTRQAQKLVVGRKRSPQVEPIIGLLDFGRRMKLIWLSAEADDPFADWFLVRIEQSLEKSKALIREKTAWLNTRMAELQGFDIQVANSLQPLHVPIFFQNPYGYMGAYLIADYDDLARSVFTARHIALIDRALAEQLLQATGKAIRRTFNLASQWKFTGVTREDMWAENPNAVRAVETFGECPKPVLSGKQRAAMAPEIRAKGQAKPVTVQAKQNDAVETMAEADQKAEFSDKNVAAEPEPSDSEPGASPNLAQ